MKKLIKKIIPIVIIALLVSEVPLQPDNLEIKFLDIVTKHIALPVITAPAPTTVDTPTTPPVPPTFRPKPSALTVTPSPTQKPPQEPNSPPSKVYIEGFGYIEYSGPNHCEIVDSEGDINKMVGYMGDEPKLTTAPILDEEYIPKNGDREIDFQTGKEEIYVEGQGFIPEN